MNQVGRNAGLLLLVAGSALIACSDATDGMVAEESADIRSSLVTLHHDFTGGDSNGWQPLVRDLPERILSEVERRLEAGESLGPTVVEIGHRSYTEFPEEESHWLIQFGQRPLPPELDSPSKQGILVQGNNHSDDMDMWIVRKLGRAEKLTPQTRYRVTLKATFASNAQEGGLGAGGSEALQILVGASPVDPTQKRIDDNQHVRFPDDVASKLTDTGEFTGNGLPFSSEKPFKLVTVTHTYEGSSSEDGTLWIMVGTHSGFESFSALYYTAVDASLEPVR